MNKDEYEPEEPMVEDPEEKVEGKRRWWYYVGWLLMVLGCVYPSLLIATLASRLSFSGMSVYWPLFVGSLVLMVLGSGLTVKK